jgi:hypothetical protein
VHRSQRRASHHSRMILPSATPSPPSGACSGPHRIYRCPGQTRKT